jgi:hypothetical protein
MAGNLLGGLRSGDLLLDRVAIVQQLAGVITGLVGVAINVRVSGLFSASVSGLPGWPGCG